MYSNLCLDCFHFNLVYVMLLLPRAVLSPRVRAPKMVPICGDFGAHLQDARPTIDT